MPARKGGTPGRGGAARGRAGGISPHYNTVATIVKLLIEKGYVTYRAFGNTYQYSAKISEREYKGTTLGEFVAQFYENSYANVVSQFVEEEKIGLDDLKALIERIEKGEQ